MQFKTIFWDNDGTLVDTEPLFYEASKKVLQTIGVDMTHQQTSSRPIKK